MKMKFKLAATFCLFLPALIMAQSSVSGFMKNKGEGTAVLSYYQEKYDEVFLVPNEIDGVPVFNEVTLTSISLYTEFGVTDRLNVIVDVPYIRAEGDASEQVLKNNGFENERKGLQDLKVYLKYKIHGFDLGNNQLNLIGSLGIETPLGDYEVNEGLQSIIAIGNHATSYNAMGIAMFKTNFGLFTSGQIGYSLRGDEVPNALLSQLKLGYAGKDFYADVFIANQLSDKDGVDILGEGFQGYFPATRVNYTRVGVNAYVPVVSGIGITGGASSYVEGRNLGKATGFYGGLAYSF
ncbi:hypothetical protein [Christiangramia salexigens]|uniref:Uncharacterized protein n=1 Tax=Christiangramia salexigens TaxID=1913577 RepID=A0A1L3J5Z2_9FLAO|nr:hypothetical protein [Christiangramia salexigens]APG60541.1 hypothetical protein LPB144_09055 [Christiangramia salexigens]